MNALIENGARNFAPPSGSTSTPAAFNPLQSVMSTLARNDFRFVTSDGSIDELRSRVDAFDDGRMKITNSMVRWLSFGVDIPWLAKTIVTKVVGFGAGKVDDADLASLQSVCSEAFPLSAIGFSRLYGPRYAAIVNGDDLDIARLHAAIERFQAINLRMLELGSRFEIKVFGHSVAQYAGGGSTGSMIVLASDSRRAKRLLDWAQEKTIINCSIGNFVKERMTRWQFWAKAAVGIVEYVPYQLRQEIIVVDVPSQSATSTAPMRLPFEFGFGLDELTS